MGLGSPTRWAVPHLAPEGRHVYGIQRSRTKIVSNRSCMRRFHQFNEPMNRHLAPEGRHITFAPNQPMEADSYIKPLPRLEHSTEVGRFAVRDMFVAERMCHSSRGVQWLWRNL